MHKIAIARICIVLDYASAAKSSFDHYMIELDSVENDFSEGAWKMTSLAPTQQWRKLDHSNTAGGLLASPCRV